MATGRGEAFSSVGPFPPLAVAIEGYLPNVAIARERLEPLGVGVVQCSEVELLPFAANVRSRPEPPWRAPCAGD